MLATHPWYHYLGAVALVTVEAIGMIGLWLVWRHRRR